MNNQRPQQSWTTLLALVCVAILFAASTVQAAHVCNIKLIDARVSIEQDEPVSTGSAICFVCLMAQAAAAVLIFFVFSPVLARRARVWFSQPHFLPSPGSFQLYVRPPPAV